MAGTVGERETWRGLEELRRGLRGLLSRHCTDENELDDVIHETYLRAARYRSNLSGKDRLRSWSMRIALNVLADRQRKNQRLVPTPHEDLLRDELVDPDPEPEEAPVRVGPFEVEKDAALALLSEARRELATADQLVLDSYYRGAESCRETARECGIPPHLVKVRLFRARRRLRRSIQRRLALRAVEPRRIGA